MPTRELDNLKESLLIYLYSHSPLMGAFFFCVSSVVINARSARTDGASVEELTCTLVKTSVEAHDISSV